jgi:hypothetical protein
MKLTLTEETEDREVHLTGHNLNLDQLNFLDCLMLFHT